MRHFSKTFLIEPDKNIESDTNEVVGLILATMILSTALRPALGGDKDSGSGFWAWMINRDNIKKDQKKNEPKKDEPKNSNTDLDNDQTNSIFNELLLLSRKANQKEKDENTKKKNDAMIKLLTACSFDKDGNELPIEDRVAKMKDNMSDEQFEVFKKDMLDTYEKCKDDDKFKDAVNKEREKITPETYEKAMEEAKKEAKSTLERLEKEKQEIEEYEKKLDELEKQLKGEKDEDKVKDLQKQIDKTKQNAPKTMASEATGVSSVSTGDKSKDEPKDEPKKSKDDIEKEYKTKSDELEKEYDEKIKNAKDDEEKEKLESEWMDKQKKLDAVKNKAVDEIEDEGKSDEEKKSKYVEKEEEITDSETGEKKKVKTYTGPRGGKFYYPDGKPKNPENKVYLEHLSLMDYLYESLV